MWTRFSILRKLWGNETSETSSKQNTTSFLSLSGVAKLNHSAAINKYTGEMGRLWDILIVMTMLEFDAASSRVTTATTYFERDENMIHNDII